MSVRVARSWTYRKITLALRQIGGEYAPVRAVGVNHDKITFSDELVIPAIRPRAGVISPTNGNHVLGYIRLLDVIKATTGIPRSWKVEVECAVKCGKELHRCVSGRRCVCSGTDIVEAALHIELFDDDVCGAGLGR